MSTTTATQSDPRRSAIDRALAMRLAATEYDRCVDLLRTLSPSDWDQPTECPGWDVRAMSGHVLGMTEMAASLRVSRRQMRAAARRGGELIDALTAVQVEENRGLSREQLVERFAAMAGKAAKARRRTPGLIRRRTMPGMQPVGDGSMEPWTFGYLLDTILTRDPWMHRVDISRATGRALHLTADHDGVLVDDVVREWASRHDHSYSLQLTGPAGGTWAAGTNGPEFELDAVEFCRVVSGRARGEGLLAVRVPF